MAATCTPLCQAGYWCPKCDTDGSDEILPQRRKHMSALGSAVRGVSGLVTGLATLFPAAGPVAALIAEAVGLAADLADVSSNPIGEITKIRRSHELLRDLRPAWEREKDEKFGVSPTDPSPPPSTIPGNPPEHPDPYGEES